MRKMTCLVFLLAGCDKSECPKGWVLHDNPSPYYCTPSDTASIASRIGTGIYGWVGRGGQGGCDENLGGCVVDPVDTPVNVSVWQPDAVKKGCPASSSGVLPVAQTITNLSLFEVTVPTGDFIVTADDPGKGCTFVQPATVRTGILEVEALLP
jgi:hypothetical protein